MRVPITKVVIDEHDLAAVQKPLESGWLVQGTFVREFEARFAEFTGGHHAIACSSCTTGLHLALAALGIGPGDEVIVPAFTWISSANVVEYQGAKVVFCDIDLDTFNISPSELKKKITPATKAVMPVHLFGLSAEMNEVLAIAKEHGLFVVEDAACGFGARYHGAHVGTLGDFGAFSFHPRKSITTGEGGMVLTANDERAALVRSLRDHGASRSDLARHTSEAAFLLAEYKSLGFNYRMTDIQGALGVTQMRKASWIMQQRTQRADAYRELLRDVPWLKLPHVPDGLVHGYQAFVCLFRPERPTTDNVESLAAKRNRMMLELEKIGVSTRQGTHAVTLQDYYARRYGISPADFPNAWLADRLTVTLPLYAQMTADEQDFVVEQLKSYDF
jgi:dTDP-4-amino-4,6-dideoxygalactose transaminase